ncbi:glycosyltransferase [uncultured Fretibacterium sp.]|uniref:glycosyltransferase n=1 Tax=uncultured Fretibacterium sp. TaxID=1678694 RepID=UPI00260A66DF|nr:glycosyltransferase [uncultured Fretibacterium sp.]
MAASRQKEADVPERAAFPRVLLLCPDLEIGGLQRVAVNLAKGLSDLGVRPTCLVLRRGGALRSLLPQHIEVHELGCTSQPLALLLPTSKLGRALRAARPDVVLSFGHMTNLLAAWAKALWGFSFSLVASEHSTLSQRIAGGSTLSRLRRRLRARSLYRKARYVVCVSQGVAEDLTALGIVPAEKARVIYNPIVDPSMPEQAKAPVDHPWLGEEVPVLLAVGRLVALKAYDDLLRAFQIFREEAGLAARLVLLGEGPERGRLEALTATLGLEDCVCFAGRQTNPYAWMARASALVLSSRCEGFGSVLAEAMACGTNVVATDCRSGPREVLEGGRWGRLVPVGDVSALARAMRDALLDPLPHADLIQAAERFSVARSAALWRDLILEAAQGDGKLQKSGER